MKLTITYFAPTIEMGDISDKDADQFREWAEEQLLNEYPQAEVEVLDQSSTVQCLISGEDSYQQEEEIKDFTSRLWDKCPWY